MATEIERKFLVSNASWQESVYDKKPMQQGYLVSDATRSIRIRIAGAKAYLNIKSGTLGISRSEYEYAIPLADAREMLAALCSKPLIEKTRYFVRYGGHIWEIDVFEGDNAGLVVAEVELLDANETLELPPWAGEEVSHDLRYYNSQLVAHPYKNW